MSPLQSLISNVNLLLAQDLADEHGTLCALVARRMSRLLSPDWLPPSAKTAGEGRYGRNLLHEDPEGRFSIGSFVWQPGQATPIHDHTCWGVIGVVQGRLLSENFQAEQDGTLRPTSTLVLPAGLTTWLAPGIDESDVHRIANRSRVVTAISIHVYGARFSAICRNQYDDLTGVTTRFVAATAQNRRA